MADRVDTFVQTVEASASQPHFDRLSARSERLQLPARHHPVLPFGQPCDPGIEVTSLL